MVFFSSTQISFPLDIPNVDILNITLKEQGAIIITVKSTREGTICQHCGRRITKFHSYGKEIELRHLPILGHQVYLRLSPRRDECPDCHGQTTTQELAWYTGKSPHTKAYDQHLMRQLINSTLTDVSRKEYVGEDAVEGAIERCLQDKVDWSRFQELNIIGIDEIALTKGHRNFAAIISTRQADGHVAILAVLSDRTKESVRAFMESIPPRLRPTIQHVCTDIVFLISLWIRPVPTKLNRVENQVGQMVGKALFHLGKGFVLGKMFA